MNLKKMIKMKFNKLFLIFLLVVAGFLLAPVFVFAYSIESINGVEILNDFAIGPAKVELELLAGQATQKNLQIINRSGRDLLFRISIEDFEASEKPTEPLKFLDNQSGQFSLKDYLLPEISEFSLKHGEKITLPINIKLPENILPGAYYGAVFVSTENIGDNSDLAIKNSLRIPALFFVRVSGDVLTEGVLENFYSYDFWHFEKPAHFDFSFRNKGNIYLNPSGSINVYNLLGKKIDTLEIPPYFVLPGSVRQQSFNWQGQWPGFYKMNLELSRGYADAKDQKSIWVAVLPWKFLILFVSLIIITVFLFIRLKKTKKYE